MIETDPVVLRFIAIMAGFVITGFGLWIGFKSVRRPAQEAADNSAPVSNGFTRMTRTELTEIKRLVTEFDQKSGRRFDVIERKIDEHLQDHAAAHVRRSEN